MVNLVICYTNSKFIPKVSLYTVQNYGKNLKPMHACIIRQYMLACILMITMKIYTNRMIEVTMRYKSRVYYGVWRYSLPANAKMHTANCTSQLLH